MPKFRFKLPTTDHIKVSIALLARIIARIYGDETFGTEDDDKMKFSIAPMDLSLNYFVGKSRLAGEKYTVIYAPSVNAEAYLIREIAYGETGLADDIRSFLGNVRYEEDRLALDEMVYMERAELKRVLFSYPDIKVDKGDVVAVTLDEIKRQFGL